MSRQCISASSQSGLSPKLLTVRDLRQKFADDPELLFDVIDKLANVNMGTSNGKRIMEAAGKAAYDAYRRILPSDLPLPWDAIPHALQAGWIAAGQAAIDTSHGSARTRGESVSEEQRIYIVVPKNLDLPDGRKFTMTCGRAIAHACHAITKLQPGCLTEISDLDMIVLAVENSGDLLKVCADLYAEKIPFVRYLDVDRSFEGEVLTAIAIHQITKHRANSLSLRLLQPWRCACNEKSKFNRFTVAVPNNAPVAQRRAPDSNQGAVAGDSRVHQHATDDLVQLPPGAPNSERSHEAHSAQEAVRDL